MTGLYRARKGVAKHTNPSNNKKNCRKKSLFFLLGFFLRGAGSLAKVRAIPTGNSVSQHSGSRQKCLWSIDRFSTDPFSDGNFSEPTNQPIKKGKGNTRIKECLGDGGGVHAWPNPSKAITKPTAKAERRIARDPIALSLLSCSWPFHEDKSKQRGASKCEKSRVGNDTVTAQHRKPCPSQRGAAAKQRCMRRGSVEKNWLVAAKRS